MSANAGTLSAIYDGDRAAKSRQKGGAFDGASPALIRSFCGPKPFPGTSPRSG